MPFAGERRPLFIAPHPLEPARVRMRPPRRSSGAAPGKFSVPMGWKRVFPETFFTDYGLLRKGT